MKITKLVHSCLLVEEDGKKILVDPGVYSWQDEKVKQTDFSDISTVIVTHNHPDHLNEDFARAVAQASPNATWYGTQETADTLEEWGIKGLLSSKDKDIKFIQSEHADLSPWFDKQSEHTSYVIFGDMLVSGDCQTLTSAYGARIIAGAINGGPWGAVVGFSKMIESMSDRPKVVVPLHDWHWNEGARNGIYARLPEVMGKFDVEFIPIENYVSREI
jgi:L-ascorbate metabolism protein UlaG (beta-lactamase superfamily)